MMVWSSSRAKKGSLIQRRRSRQSSQEVDSLRLSDDLNQNTTASQGLSSPEGVPSTPESVIHKEHSSQLDNNMAIVDHNGRYTTYRSKRNGPLLIKEIVSRTLSKTEKIKADPVIVVDISALN